MIDHGFVLDGEIVPDTEWIRRDSDYFWTGGRGTRPRAAFIDLLAGHWTGGEATVRSYDDDGPHVVRVMRARRRPDGSPLNVGIHFVIGACDDDEINAPIWQTMDPGLFAATHVGMGSVNRRSIGTEVVSAGLPGPFDARTRPRSRVPLLGRMTEVLRFRPGQLRTWRRLAEMLASLNGRAGVAIPRRIPPFGATRRFTKREMATYAGAMEHLHVPTTTKKDAGGLLIGELDAAGWSRG